MNNKSENINNDYSYDQQTNIDPPSYIDFQQINIYPPTYLDSQQPDHLTQYPQAIPSNCVNPSLTYSDGTVAQPNDYICRNDLVNSYVYGTFHIFLYVY